jgi:hypothetical protein
VAVLLSFPFVAVACASSTPSPSSHTTGATGTAGTGTSAVTQRTPLPAGPNPSAVSKMVCSREAEKEINYALGVAPLQPLKPTWVNHVYSCLYRYPDGVIVLSVKELSSYPETKTYFGGLARRLGDTVALSGLGQGAFSTRNGSVVVRKDYKVLVVDVSGLPARFGHPATRAGDVAITVADVVMACWAGD